MFHEAALQNIEAAKEAAEVKETALKEMPSGSEILPPDMETITTRSLESIRKSNLEAHDVNETANVGIEEKKNSNLEEGRPLTEQEKIELAKDTGMNENALEKCTIKDNGEIQLKCVNEDKEGVPSEVPYIRKTIEVNGRKVTVVVPEFPDAVYETILPKDLWREDDYTVFKHCTEELKKAIQADPELGKQFTSEQLEQIKNGEPRIKGLTWHHDAECGHMQLLPSDIHSQYRHTGGKMIWGGGRP